MSLQPFGFSDKTDYVLLASNVLTIVLALVFDWGLLTIMWIYWAQSVIIGVFHFFKLLLSGMQSKENPYYNTGIEGLQKFVGVFGSVFFAVHYGMFHFVYFVFLTAFSVSEFFVLHERIDFIGIIFVSAVFLANHAFSFWQHVVVNKEHLNRSPMAMFGEPYARIIPMQLTIIFGAFFMTFLPELGKKIALVFFLGLKTLADLSSHLFMHRKPRQEQPVQIIMVR